MRVDNTYKNNPNYFDVLIIGAGPGGISAAIYSQRASLKTGIIEKDAPGGKMVKTAFIENYPGFKNISGPDLAYSMFDQMNHTGVKYLYGNVIEVKKVSGYFHVSCEDGMVRYSKVVIIASGMNEKKIGIPGENEYYGKGLSYCAICDGPLYKYKPIAVIGGGNSALEEALYLSDLSSNVHLIHRRKEFRADKSVVDKVKKNENITLHLDNVPIKFVGDGKKIISIDIQDVNTKSITNIKVDCIFPFLGFLPVNNFVSNFDITNENGFIIVDENMATKIEGLYSIGDVNNKQYRQISTAINDGTIAALNAKKYIDDTILV
ncbi:MAG: thioredoxin-disulfide reductase [Malacoplasma sp.]